MEFHSPFILLPSVFPLKLSLERLYNSSSPLVLPLPLHSSFLPTNSLPHSLLSLNHLFSKSPTKGISLIQRNKLPKGQSWGVRGFTSGQCWWGVQWELDLETKEQLVGKTRLSILVRWGGGKLWVRIWLIIAMPRGRGKTRRITSKFMICQEETG